MRKRNKCAVCARKRLRRDLTNYLESWGKWLLVCNSKNSTRCDIIHYLGGARVGDAHR